MILHQGIHLCVTVISLWMCWSVPVYPAASAIAAPQAERVFSLKTQQDQSTDQVIKQLAQADVVYLAETHDRLADHQAQLDILRSLARFQPLIIGMEMFQRPYQWALNQYLAEEINETDLLRLTQYQQRWGYDWQLYAPILRFARERRIPVLALNAPSEVTRKVARSGLESLTAVDRQWIPPVSAIRAEPEAYRQRLRQIYDDIHQGRGSGSSFERFFLAQVLWDETMADRIAIALHQSPDPLIVVLAGQGHILYRYGIPDRVARRVAVRRSRPLRQLTVILNPSNEMQPEPTIADYFWYSPSKETEAETAGRK